MDEARRKALPTRCTIEDGNLIPCWAITEQVEGSANFGVHFLELMNFRQRTVRNAGVFLGKWNGRKKGDKIAFNFCPFCGVNLHTDNGGYLPGTEPPEIRAKRLAAAPSPRDLPRRCYVDLYTPAESAIREAVQRVEEAGAHPLLTDAVVLLGQAQDKVADFVDLDNRAQ